MFAIDDTGLMLDVGSLPQRIRRPKALVFAREGTAEGHE